MKFIRSLPLMWARTRWPFSNSTANIVLGSGSMTVPSTSIASFLATGSRSSLSRTECRPEWADTRTVRISTFRRSGNCQAGGSDGGEDLRAVLGDRDAVLEMGGERTVAGHDRPVVGLHDRLVAAEGEHRLDGQAQAGLDPPAGLAGAVVGDLGILVHRPADAVADELADDAVALRPGHILDRRADVADPVARLGRGDAGHHRQAGRVDQVADGRRRVADEEGPGTVTVPAVDDRAGVDRHDLAGPDRPLAGDAVDDLVVDRDADAGRERPPGIGPGIALERRDRPAPPDVGLGQGVEVGGADPRLQLGFDEGQDLGHDPPGAAHPIDLGSRLQADGHQLSPPALAARAAASSASVTAATDWRPSIVRSRPRSR